VAIYGPFKVDGKYTTQSNEAFDKEILAPKVPSGAERREGSRTVANAHGIALKRYWTCRRTTLFSCSVEPERNADERCGFCSGGDTMRPGSRNAS